MDKDLYIDKIIENYKKYHNPSLARLLRITGYSTVEYKAKGMYIYDIKGNKYLDFLGGYGVFFAGHSPDYIIEKVKKQLDLMPLSSKVFFNDKLAILSEKLASILGNDIQFSFFVNSGTEAVEGALKLARLYTGRSKIISLKGAFHGKTFGSLSASGREIYKTPFKPLVGQFYQIEFNNYQSLKQIIDSNTAAIIVELIQGEGGINIINKEFLQKIRQLCDKYSCLLIFDEVQTGMGRTGKNFSMQHYNIKPDIITLGKALGGGVMPIASFSATKEVWQAFYKNPLIHTSTFGGGQLACTAASAAIDLLLIEKLSDNAQKMGNYLLENLKEIKNKYLDIIKDIRGKGLMIGIEFIEEKYAGALIGEFTKNKIIVAYTLNQPKVIRLEPPLIVKKEHIDILIEVLDKSLKKVKDMFLKEGVK